MYNAVWWFKKFCEGDESLEDEEHNGQPLESNSNQLRAIIEANPLTTTEKLPKNSMLTILQSFGI